MIIQREQFTPSLYSEMAPLLHTNSKEVNNIFGELKPNLETYFTMELQGFLDIFVAREKGVMLGYMGFVTYNHLHYKTKTVSVQDLFYISPDNRSGFVGTKLIKYAENYLKEVRNVDFMLLVSLAVRDIAKMFERQGYSKLETTYFKHIGGN
jgi:hypothetical protein